MPRENPYFWAAEGFRQLRLGLAWARLAWLTRKLPHPTQSGATLGAWLKDEVVKDFLQPVWLPGVQGCLQNQDNLAKIESPPPWTWPGAYLDQVEQLYTRALQHARERSPKEVALHESAKDLVPVFDACIEAALQSNAAPPSIGRLPTIHVHSPMIAEAWLLQARALERWNRAAAYFGNLAPPSSEVLQTLSRECQQTSNVMQERHRFHTLLRFIPGQSAKTHQALDQASLVLRQVSEKLAQMAGSAVDSVDREHHAELNRWFSVALAEEERIPRQAAVRQLVELPERLARQVDPRFKSFLSDLISFWDGRKRKPWKLPVCERWTQELKARAQIVMWIIEYFDQAAAKDRLPEGAWETLTPWLELFLKGEVAATLVRKPNAWSETFDAVEVDAPQVNIETTGLALIQADKAVVLRKAKLHVPRRPHPLEAALRRLSGRLAATDPALAALCEELADLLVSRARVAGPPLPPDVNTLPLLWRLGQRVAALPVLDPSLGAAACEVLTELGELGYALTECPRPPYEQQLAQGPWLLITAPTIRDTIALPSAASNGRAVAMRLPDSRLLVPAVWLMVPAARMDEHPLVKCLRDAEPLLAGLKFRYPQWPGWTAYDASVWDLAHGEPRDPRTMATDQVLAKRLLQDLHRCAAGRDAAEANAFRELTRRIYRCLTDDLHIALTPPLDPTTLEPAPLTTRPTDGTQVELVPSERPFGEVLAVEEFGVPGSPGTLRVSGGPGYTRELVQWLSLPPSVFAGLPSDPQKLEGHPLSRFHEAVQQAAWQPRRPADLIASGRTEFQTWLRTEVGRTWFHQWMLDVSLVREGAAPIRLWHDALLRDRWFRCIPAKDGQAVLWPRDVKLPEHVEFTCSATLPAWRVVPGTELFAATPELAKATISLGPRVPGGLLDATWRLADTVAAIDAGAEALAATRTLTRAAAENSLLQTPLADVEMHLLTILDTVLETAAAPAPGVNGAPLLPRLQEALTAARTLGALLGLEILPASFTFTGGLAAAATSAHTPAGQPLFGGWGEMGSERLLHFGLSKNQQPIRAPETGVCAGPAPTNYDAIRRHLAAGTDPKLAALVDSLDAWPRKAIDGTLPYAIQDFFVKFWSAAGSKEAELVRRVEKELNELLETDLHLEPFYPHSTLDFPDGGLEIRADGPIRTGEVRRVIRPGLRARDGAVPVKAIVEAE